MRKKEKRFLAFSFALSVALHVFAIVAVQRYSFWFSKGHKAHESVDWLACCAKKELNEILKTAFAVKNEKTSLSVYTHQESGSAFKEVSPQLEKPPAVRFLKAPLWPKQNLSAPNLVLPTFTIPSARFNLLEYLPKDMIATAFEHKVDVSMPLIFSPLKSEGKAEFKPLNLPIEESSLSEVACLKPKDASYVQELKAPLPTAVIAMPDLPTLPSLAELNTLSVSDSFDAELSYAQKNDGTGYIFALTLIPKEDLDLPKIRQHYTFLIDRSNSIQQGRLRSTKEAVLQALDELSSDDTFNIIAFDSKVEKMAPVSLSCNSESKVKARAFLDNVQLGSFFATTDLFKPLFLTVPSSVQKDEVYTTLLFTDAEVLSRKNNQQALVYEWTRYNQGKSTLYTVGMDDLYSPTLEVAATFNKGKHWYVSTQRGMKRKLLKLMKSIQTPVAKDICCKIISHVPNAQIRIVTPSHQMSNLCIDQPYVILGETESLDDFIFFFQGKLKNRWINVRKNISFINAKKGTNALKMEWAVQQSLTLYERYLIEQDNKYLTDAKSLLEPFNLPVAFSIQ